MKWALALIIVAPGFQSYAKETPPAESKVQYKSWCQNERVMTTDRDGQVYAAWDCSEISESSRCEEQSEKIGQFIFTTATCRESRKPFAYKPMFCESYEDFEDCPPRQSGPDDPDDGDGGRTEQEPGPDDLGSGF